MTAALAGHLILRPGAGLPAIASSRAPLAGRLLHGRPAQQAPLLLASLYALCGQAHRLTAQLAVDAARGLRTAATPEEQAALAAETMREHVRRIWLDWPRLFGVADADLGALRACPLLQQGGADMDAVRAWIASALTGQPASSWLSAWRADPLACMARWSGQGRTMPARLLGGVAAVARALEHAGTPLLAHAQPGTLAALAAAMDGAADFESRPRWQGLCCETGSWTRLGGAQRAGSAWLRLGARVADLAALAGGEQPALGALRLGPGEALAWSEMARGLLLHWVRLDAETGATVAAYRIVAPTEWNFHPHGAAASMLAQMPSARDAQQRAAVTRSIGVLAAAFDPCVSYQIEFDHA